MRPLYANKKTEKVGKRVNPFAKEKVLAPEQLPLGVEITDPRNIKNK